MFSSMGNLLKLLFLFDYSIFVRLNCIPPSSPTLWIPWSIIGILISQERPGEFFSMASSLHTVQNFRRAHGFRSWRSFLLWVNEGL